MNSAPDKTVIAASIHQTDKTSQGIINDNTIGKTITAQFELLGSLFQVTNCRTFLCCTFNAQSLVNKLCELHHILYHDTFDLVFITETWLHADIPSGLLDPEAMYYVLRKDRAFSHSAVRGGDVCVFVNCKMSV